MELINYKDKGMAKLKLTEHQKEVLEKIKAQGYVIELDRQTNRVRVVKSGSTEVMTVNKQAFSSLLNKKIIECVGLNKCIVNYSIRPGVYV